MFKKKKGDSKLDLMLKEGASNKKKTIDMDKAISSTAHRLLREKIQFTKASGDLNATEQYKQSGFIILVPKDEEKALERLSKATKNIKKQPKVKAKRKKQLKKKIKKKMS